MSGELTSLYLKHRKGLGRKKGEIRHVIEAANLDYLERDKAFHQINEIKKLAQKEAKDYESKLRELIEHSERPMHDSIHFVHSHNSGRQMRGSGFHSKDLMAEMLRPKSGKVS